MTGLRSAYGALALVADAAFSAPLSDGRASDDLRADAVTIGSVADQLGVKVTGRADEEFAVGVQFTSILVNPEKLAAFGIKGMHAGARVVAARLSADRVYVEADELDPPRRASARVSLDKDGKLVLPPKV